MNKSGTNYKINTKYISNKNTNLSYDIYLYTLAVYHYFNAEFIDWLDMYSHATAEFIQTQSSDKSVDKQLITRFKTQYSSDSVYTQNIPIKHVKNTCISSYNI